MLFKAAGATNKGCVKETNQDSYLIQVANTNFGDVALVAVADGMGGLDKGELASATVVRALSEWFKKKLPLSLETMGTSIDGFEGFVQGQWNGLIQELNLSIMRYGLAYGAKLGTTVTAMLAVGGRYSIVHVGDSRVYKITNDTICQLTEDQTYIKREMDAGRITPEEALTHPDRNVLLQCIGASQEVVPSIVHGTLSKGANYLLCSDGFRHVLSDSEIQATFLPEKIESSWEQLSNKSLRCSYPAIESLLSKTIDLVMSRKEHDNITAVLLKVEGGDYNGNSQ